MECQYILVSKIEFNESKEQNIILNSKLKKSKKSNANLLLEIEELKKDNKKKKEIILKLKEPKKNKIKNNKILYIPQIDKFSKKETTEFEEIKELNKKIFNLLLEQKNNSKLNILIETTKDLVKTINLLIKEIKTENDENTNEKLKKIEDFLVKLKIMFSHVRKIE